MDGNGERKKVLESVSSDTTSERGSTTERRKWGEESLFVQMSFSSSLSKKRQWLQKRREVLRVKECSKNEIEDVFRMEEKGRKKSDLITIYSTMNNTFSSPIFSGRQK